MSCFSQCASVTGGFCFALRLVLRSWAWRRRRWKRCLLTSYSTSDCTGRLIRSRAICCSRAPRRRRVPANTKPWNAGASLSDPSRLMSSIGLIISASSALWTRSEKGGEFCWSDARLLCLPLDGGVHAVGGLVNCWQKLERYLISDISGRWSDDGESVEADPLFGTRGRGIGPFYLCFAQICPCRTTL